MKYHTINSLSFNKILVSSVGLHIHFDIALDNATMVSLESYICLCSESEGLALMSTRSGKQYIKCKKSGCGYFTNTEQFGQYNDILA